MKTGSPLKYFATTIKAFFEVFILKKTNFGYFSTVWTQQADYSKNQAKRSKKLHSSCYGKHLILWSH